MDGEDLSIVQPLALIICIMAISTVSTIERMHTCNPIYRNLILLCKKLPNTALWQLHLDPKAPHTAHSSNLQVDTLASDEGTPPQLNSDVPTLSPTPS